MIVWSICAERKSIPKLKEIQLYSAKLYSTERKGTKWDILRNIWENSGLFKVTVNELDAPQERLEYPYFEELSALQFTNHYAP